MKLESRRRKWVIIIICTILLLAARIWSFSLRQTDEAVAVGMYHELLPTAVSFEPLTESTAIALDRSDRVLAYVGLSSNMGYGGPMVVGVIVEPDGKLLAPVILSNNETPSFLMRIEAAGYFRQFVNKPVNGMFALGEDIDAVSGATLSSRAVSDGVRESANAIAGAAFGLRPEQPDSKWRIGAGEFAAILLFLLGWCVYRYKKLRRHRLVFLGLSLLVLGFWLNRPLSAVQFTSLLLGFLPSPATNLLFYIVLLGVILPLAFSGKNIYCAYICPYSALQEFAGKISGKNISLGKLRRFLPVIRNALLFTILMAAAITGKATAVAFEPFGVAFSLDLTAATYIWVILFVSLGLSFLFKRLWCIGFCPAGAFLDILRQISTALRRPRG